MVWDNLTTSNQGTTIWNKHDKMLKKNSFHLLHGLFRRINLIEWRIGLSGVFDMMTLVRLDIAEYMK